MASAAWRTPPAITGAVSPSGFDFGKSVLVLLMVVLGGMGNVWGVTIGAFLLSWLNSDGLKQIGVQIDDCVRHLVAAPAPLQLHHPRACCWC